MEEKIISEKKRDSDQSVEDSDDDEEKMSVVHNGCGDFFIFKKSGHRTSKTLVTMTS